MGWARSRNGELLALAAAAFDVFITADRNLSYQQDLSSFDIAIVVLVAHSNRFEDLRRLAPRILEVLATAQRGAAIRGPSGQGEKGDGHQVERIVTKMKGAICDVCVRELSETIDADASQQLNASQTNYVPDALHGYSWRPTSAEVS